MEMLWPEFVDMLMVLGGRWVLVEDMRTHKCVGFVQSTCLAAAD
jgi:hypothetical protein